MNKDERKAKSTAVNEATFAKDLANYCADYMELSRMRSFQEPDIRPVETVMNAIQSYCKTSAKRVAVLCYFFEDDRLTLSILSNTHYNNGILYSRTFVLASKDLAIYESTLKGALEIATHTRSVSPTKRKTGIHLFRAGRNEPAPQGTKANLSEAIKAISNLLFPDRTGNLLLEESIEHLVIVPSLNIQQIPFSILQPFGDETYLIDHWSYSIVPSVYDFIHLNNVGFRANHFNSLSKNALIVGNPAFAHTSEWVLPPLPGAEEEARSIGKFLNVDMKHLIIGEGATIDIVRQKIAKAKLLYFATHGIADPKHPLDGSGLFFAPTDKDPTGLLTAREIQYLKLNNCLVILSACQTGLGDPHDAGTISLSRAFQLAGASHTIMSLWSVDDHSTKELMMKFVKYLKEGYGVFPHDPLRKAMLEYKQENPNPLYWASFSTFGIS